MNKKYALDFEKPLRGLKDQLDALHQLSEENHIDVSKEINAIEAKIEQTKKSIYSNLSSWQRVQLARHPLRPYSLDYVGSIFENFQELHGDRLFRDDKSILGGIAFLDGKPIMVIAQQKGRNTKENILRNFGMPNPEGYRKAIRLMNLANKFSLPVISFVDTAGAYPGVDAEARGQAEAIARSMEACLNIKVPMISIIIGEGGSGGAMAIATANTVIMLEHSIYSVISPEGCASILWRDNDARETAAEALKLTAQDLEELGVIDSIVPEPMGGAHRRAEDVFKAVNTAIEKALVPLLAMDGDALKAARRAKFLEMGKKGLA